MKSTKKTIRMTDTFYDQIAQHYKDIYSEDLNISNTIQQGIKNAILQQYLSQKKRTETAQSTLAVIQKDKTKKNRRVSVRIDESALAFLMDYYETSSITEAILCCLYDVLNPAATNKSTLNESDNLFYMPGQKNPEMQEFLNKVFEDICRRFPIDGYVEIFCGTANVILHTPKIYKEFLNDNCVDLINLLRVIKNYWLELFFELYSMPICETTFNSAKKHLNSTKNQPNSKKKEFYLKSSKKAQIKRAAAFYFYRYASVRGDGSSYNKRRDDDNFHTHLTSLYPISQRLQGVDIKQRNAIYFLKTLCGNTKNCLIYFDPPYLYTEKYYKINNKTTFRSHKALCKRAIKLRCQNNICLISYRITASTSMKKRNKTDALLRQTLDQLYQNKGFYFTLKKLGGNCKGQIEILLSTVPFCGSHPYDTPLAELEVEKYV